MSNFKKFLALALAAMMVVGMMVFAPAASAYEPTGEYKDSIALLNAFDVMLGDGVSFGEKEEVTRWQMALLIARIVTGETGNAMWEGEKSDYFTDVTAEHFPGAIDFCAELGIIKGVGDNKYDPEAPIIYQDALTMIVRLLGYETETTTYPWGYILESRNIYYSVDDNPEHDVYLGAKINTGYKTNLLREEVAELLAVMIYVPVLNAAGKPGANLITSGLKCEDLGTYTLVATNTAAIDSRESKDLAKYGEVIFTNANNGQDPADLTVKVANVTKGELDLNNYLGFTAKLARVKKTIVATMDSVTVYDAGEFKLDGAKIKIGKTSYATTVYGTSETKVFVEAKAGDLSLNGRVYLCGKAARFVPYNNVKALAAVDIKVTTEKKWPANTTAKLYYEANDGAYSITAKEVLVSLWKPNNSGLKGLFLNGTVTNNSTAADGGGARTALADVKYIESTSFRVTVDGSIINGEPFLGNLTKVGNASFITVVKHPDIVTGTAKFNGTGDKVVKLGDTEFSVGYAATGSAVNGWYTSFDDSASFIALAGSDVDYTTVDGRLVSVKKHDGTTTPTDKKPDEYTKTPLVLVINEDGANVTVNDDDTLTVAALNLATGAVETVKIDQVDGARIGRLINLFGLQGAENAGEVLLNFLGFYGSNDAAAVHTNLKNGSKAAYSVLVTVANKTGDVYSVSSTVDKYTQVRLKDNKAELTFKKYATSAISTSTYTQVIYDAANSTATVAKYKDAAAKYLTVTADTEILVIAKDQMGTIKGAVPADGSFLKLYTDEASQFVFELSNNRIVIYNAAKNFADITDITKSAAPVVVEGGWYTLTWKTTYVGMEIVKDGDKTYYNYTFDNMYNLTTKKNETVVISADAYYPDPSKDYPDPAEFFFGACWTDGKKTPLTAKADADAMFKFIDKKPADNVNDQQNYFYRPYYISNELGSGAQVSSMISWGLANGYLIGRIDKTTYGDPNTLVIKNLTATEGNGSYTLTVNPATDKDIDVVVNYSMFVMNQSPNSTADEFHIVGVTSTNEGYNGKALNNTLFWRTEQHDSNNNVVKIKDEIQYWGENEVVLYKLDEKTGTAEVIVNFVDGLGVKVDHHNLPSTEPITVRDVCASAPAVEG